jgi:LacI family transcriptional regulator
MPSPSRIITLRQIAKQAKLSVATVSYALRGHPKVPESTKERVLKIANSLGFRPNPRVAALMAHIRNSRGPGEGERIAFVWVHTSEAESRGNALLQTVREGAQRRALQYGYEMEEFWLDGKSMTDLRLATVIRTRGITGIVFSPVMHEDQVELNFPWADFSCSVVGLARWKPELHRAAHHLYVGMHKTLEELAKLGCRRPAVVLDWEANSRSLGAWEAAFVLHHPDRARAQQLILHGLPGSRAELAAWLAAQEPDWIILHNPSMVKAFLELRPQDSPTRISVLEWYPQLQGIPGIDQRFDQIAESAVDLVVAQLISNERGIPTMPRMTLYGGRWVGTDGPSGPGDPTAAPKIPSFAGEA